MDSERDCKGSCAGDQPGENPLAGAVGHLRAEHPTGALRSSEPPIAPCKLGEPFIAPTKGEGEQR